MSINITRVIPWCWMMVCLTGTVWGGVGDPQIRTDHPWYPGELALSTFDRLFATQAEQYRRATGIDPVTDEDRALASWFFRNIHYAHGEEGAEDWWDAGFGEGFDPRGREYWTGLFAHGFGLCGTTHSQWTAEFEHLLGHGRARGVGVSGHNSLEVFLTGGAYGAGRWAMLDHDLSTVIFDVQGTRLLGLEEIAADYQRLMQRDFAPDRQRGWLVCGLHPDDGHAYARYEVAEYHAGYAGPPPMIVLRRGESLRRYFAPGLDNGTYVFWGRNYNAGLPGPERPRTWVNQPEAMHGSQHGAGYVPGQVRYGNAVYTYRPDFSSGDYREGVVSESADHVTFEFRTPYIIGATPPDDSPWGVYLPGGRNGLVIESRTPVDVDISLDGGFTWHSGGRCDSLLDLTDLVKGFRQYHLRFGSGAGGLIDADLTITTVCQTSEGVLPRLKDSGTRIDYAASGREIISAGPTLAQARACVIEGEIGSPRVTMELTTPRGAPIVALYAAAHVASSSPPSPEVRYQIEYSLDDGQSWQPIVADWRIERRGAEPADFWSQSLCFGDVELADAGTGEGETAGRDRARFRFRNDGGKRYLRTEAHLAYALPGHDDALQVTYAWTDSSGSHQATHRFVDATSWELATGEDVRTLWVEMQPVE